VVGKKLTSPLFRVIARAEWIAAADEADVSSVCRKLEMKFWISTRHCANILENRPGEERVIDST